jgi:pyruvate/2-oxoglutarate dehydrogenase complex dihydrolipoamide dehydrogenase (E3) component
MGVIRRRKRDIVTSWREGSTQHITSVEGVDLLMGEARFTGQKTLDVQMNTGETRQVSAEQIFINVGARPGVPPIEGLDSVPYLDSTSIMELGSVPEHLLILGGGYIGVEFGQMFRRFGSEVTIVQRGDYLLPREDEDVSEEVIKIFREDDITVLTGSSASKVEREGDSIVMHLDTANGSQTVRGSHLLVAIGRTYNTDLLNTEAAGLETGKRGILVVNERLETNVPGIYALGDVKGGPAFTHISYDDFRIIRTNLLEGGNATMTDRLVPYTVFMDPQLGRVGLTEEQAREQGRNIKVAKIPMEWVARAIETDETRGFMKAVVDADTDLILGVAMLGIEGGELAGALQIAMMGNVTSSALREGVFSHPTLVESFNNLFSAME